MPNVRPLRRDDGHKPSFADFRIAKPNFAATCRTKAMWVDTFRGPQLPLWEIRGTVPLWSANQRFFDIATLRVGTIAGPALAASRAGIWIFHGLSSVRQ